jgi:hypothetical protein
MTAEILDNQKREAKLCPHFDSCSAPVCPLASDWHRAQHLPGERVCIWLREVVKPGGIRRIATAATEKIADTVTQRLPAIMASSSDIRHKLVAASRSGSKLANMHAARERMTQAAEVAPKPSRTSAAAYAASRSGYVGDDHGRR